MTKNKMIYASNKNTQGVGYVMEDFGILWIWGFCGDSHRFFCGYGMGMGIKIQSPRQPCLILIASGARHSTFRPTPRCRVLRESFITTAAIVSPYCCNEDKRRNTVRPGTHWRQSRNRHGRLCRIRESRPNVERTFEILTTKKITRFRQS